jgi:putative alpha-1,2-mannosidase
MGFYPVNPASGEYVIGAPQMPRIRWNLPNGKSFMMIAHKLSKENKYVKSVTLNGNPVQELTISYNDIMAGGTLEFEMIDQPQ